MNRNIVVIGSINMDLVINTNHFPTVGETVLAQDFNLFAGGKGANQAVAGARLGANVYLIGAVGNDAHGAMLTAHLAQQGVRTEGIHTINNIPTGQAIITIAQEDNQIIVIPGANQALQVADILAHEALIAQADVVLTQLEIPLDCVELVCKLAQKYHKPLILNPAPACRLPENILTTHPILTPNQHEFKKIFSDYKDISKLDKAWQNQVIITLGQQGVGYFDQGEYIEQSAFVVKVKDTTGAGDTFNGALAVYWHLGKHQAIHYACASSALSTTKLGAQSAMPDQESLQQFLINHPFIRS